VARDDERDRIRPPCGQPADQMRARELVDQRPGGSRPGAERFLFSSSCSNYGTGGDAVLDESASFNPVTAYGISKVRAEHDLRDLATGDFSPVLLRSATAYGVSPRLRSDIVLNNPTAWAVATGKVLIKSDGTPWRPIVHVEDITRAFLAALRAPREAIHAQAFNVARPSENYRIRELARDRRRDGGALHDRVRRRRQPRHAQLWG
jgi:nucleoside-diphosphate-sugar epimerase